MSPGLIVDKFNNLSRDTIYLRADVFDLFNNRGGNVTLAIERIIERVDTTLTRGSTIVSAFKLASIMESQGRRVKVRTPRSCLSVCHWPSGKPLQAVGHYGGGYSGAKAATPNDSQKREQEG